MYSVYILKSNAYWWFYVGMTDNLLRRFKEHNSGKTKSTKSKAPFDIIFTKEFNTRIDAMNYEKYLKTGSGREYIKKFYCSSCAGSSVG